MRVNATRGTLVVRFENEFAAQDARRLSECLSAFSPVSLLTLEFRHVRLDEAALASLARLLQSLRTVKVRLRGLPLHQLRFLDRSGSSIGLDMR